MPGRIFASKHQTCCQALKSLSDTILAARQAGRRAGKKSCVHYGHQLRLKPNCVDTWLDAKWRHQSQQQHCGGKKATSSARPAFGPSEKKCENIKYLRAITKMKSRKMKAINRTQARGPGSGLRTQLTLSRSTVPESQVRMSALW